MYDNYFGMSEADMAWLARKMEREDNYWLDRVRGEYDEPKENEEDNKDDFTEEEGILLGIYTGGGLF